MRRSVCRWFNRLSSTRSRLLQHVGSAGRRAVRPDAITTTIFSDQKVHLLPDDMIDFHLYVYHVWEPVETAVFIESIWPGHDIVLDIGAHLGYYTLVAQAAGASRVISVEPSPENAGRLRHNLRLNDLAQNDVWQCAIARDSGEITFNIAGRNSGRNSLGAVPRVEFTYPIQIQSKSLAQLVGDAALSQIDLLKMDIEGAEFDALEAGLAVVLANPKLIMMVGIHPENLEAFGCTHQDVWNLLANNGFAMFNPEWPQKGADALQRLDRFPETRRPYTLLCLQKNLADDQKFMIDYQSRILRRLSKIAPDRAHGRGVTV